MNTAQLQEDAMIQADKVSAAARCAFEQAKAAGQDDGMALDAAADVVRDLVGPATGFFDAESLTWTYDIAASADVQGSKRPPHAARRDC
jgi:hypothetical protein